MNFVAHFKHTKDGTIVTQSVQEHCRNTANIAAEKMKCVNLDKAAYLAGLMHDMGKCHTEFCKYIADAMDGKNVARGSVVHSHAAARYFLENFHGEEGRHLSDITAEVLAYAVGAHHGLFDCFGENYTAGKGSPSGFSARLQWDDKLYKEACENYFALCTDEEEVRKLFTGAAEQLEPILCWAEKQRRFSAQEYYFVLGLVARLLLSAVIDGDRTDTVNFEKGGEYNSAKPCWGELLERVEGKLKLLVIDNGNSKRSEIQWERAQISSTCRQAAELSPGIFRMNVPTGGGKTLSSLRFALAHAKKYNKNRIIFLSPLLSILDQNAKEIRKYISDDNIVLEHHSNVVQEKNDKEEVSTQELMIQNWDAPIIITTLVQFLNTLFSGKTSCIRRFNSLCDSVIVIDEIQTVPLRMLSLFNTAVNFLAAVCKATVVLCSATQPCLEESNHPIREEIHEIIPCDEGQRLREVFRRTRIVNCGSKREDQLPQFIAEILPLTASLLVVCNKKKQAADIYNSLKGGNYKCFHLSASMCQAHRKKVISELKEALANKEKTLCISTQVIEAGVDISFESVVRLQAGMDNIVQAAGRCNRNGEAENELGKVYVVDCSNEKLTMLPEMSNAKEMSKMIFDTVKNEQGETDILSDETITKYYRYLYKTTDKQGQEFPLKSGQNLYDMLSTNFAYASELKKEDTRYELYQAFKSAGEKFSVFDNDTYDVIVPYGEGRKIIAALGSEKVKADKRMQEQLIKQAAAYSVSVYNYQKNNLFDKGGISEYLDGRVLVLTDGFYDEGTGLSDTSRLDFKEE